VSGNTIGGGPGRDRGLVEPGQILGFGAAGVLGAEIDQIEAGPGVFHGPRGHDHDVRLGFFQFVAPVQRAGGQKHVGRAAFLGRVGQGLTRGVDVLAKRPAQSRDHRPARIAHPAGA
jgi:hypothetical protein